MKMHDLYLCDLQRIERLCTRLHLLHPDNAVVQKLREMLIKHIRPLIALVKVIALTRGTHNKVKGLNASHLQFSPCYCYSAALSG